MIDKIFTQRLDALPDEKNPDLLRYSGHSLLMLTESPHWNIYQWASNIYEQDGIITKQKCIGYHTYDVWMSVLYQIVAELYALQINEIYMEYITMEDNICTKNLKIKGNTGGYWK